MPRIVGGDKPEIEYECVRCGSYVVTENQRYDRNRNCAPCCDDCRTEVIAEIKKGAGMWPRGYNGGWLWSDTKRRWIDPHG